MNKEEWIRKLNSQWHDNMETILDSLAGAFGGVWMVNASVIWSRKMIIDPEWIVSVNDNNSSGLPR